MKNHIHLFVLLLTAFSLTAQDAKIEGSIADASGGPLGFANVLLLNQADSSLYRGEITDVDGRFVFEKVKTGKYLLQSTMVGYNKVYSDTFTHDGINSTTIPILSLTNGVSIEEVTVTGKKPLIELHADKMILNVDNSSISAGNSALEILQKAPGVIVDNNQNISLRGKQGVLVTINGKNQYLSGEEITRLLENMPATNIKNIEIVTNPSAKYDAEGNSGIINIVLKKNENLGTNGSLSSTFRQGWRTSHFQNLNLNYRSEKVNVYGGAEYYNFGWQQNLDLVRTIPFGEGETVFDQKSKMIESGDGYNLKLGIDYLLSPMTTVSLLAKRNAGDEQDDNNTTTDIRGINMPAFDVLLVEAYDNEEYMQNTLNANIRHKFNDEGLELTLDADISQYRNDGSFNYDNFFQDQNGNSLTSPYFLRNNQGSNIDIFAGKIDFTIPVSKKMNLEFGAKTSMVSTENSTLFEDQNADGQWMSQVERSNDFMYDEDVWAAYANGSGSFGKIMIQAGLRLEQTRSEGRSITLNQSVPRKYTNLFPSLSLSTEVVEGQNVSLTYSRRLERPNYRDLNPFENYLDQYTFQRGNPFLNPQYSNAFGLNYSIGRSLFISLNYSHTTDANTEVIEQESSENKTFQTRQNLDDFNNFSATVSMPRVITEWWTTRLNLTTFYNEYSSVIPSGILDNSDWAHVLNINNELNLPGEWQAEVSGQFQSGMVFGLFQIDPRAGLDLGVSRKILKGKGNLKINMSDVFRSQNSTVKILQDDINLLVEQVNDTRRLTVNFSYSFGNQKVKAARKRRTAAQDEAGRI